ncbi:hypothetical protein VNO77_01720 [Canavalia gladiata]|uniref:Uncharacterized protein n=1 Tax=Canavalia gladiata TaxID=3824 RepID=A0AAN9MRN4_CANGL
MLSFPCLGNGGVGNGYKDSFLFVLIWFTPLNCICEETDTLHGSSYGLAYYIITDFLCSIYPFYNSSSQVNNLYSKPFNTADYKPYDASRVFCHRTINLMVFPFLKGGASWLLNAFGLSGFWKMIMGSNSSTVLPCDLRTSSDLRNN